MSRKSGGILISVLSIILFPITVIIFTVPILVFFFPLMNVANVIWVLRVIIILWLAVFVFSIFLLSSYCGFLCPITKLFGLIVYITKNKSILTHRFHPVVGIVTQILWIASAIYVITRMVGGFFSFFPKEEVFSRIEVIILFSLYGIAAILLRTNVASDDLGHYLCPLSTYIKVGIWLNKILRFPAFRIVINPDNCKECGLCNKICSYQNDVQSMVKSGTVNYKVCSNCGKCIDACRQNAIKRKWEKSFEA